MNDAEYMRLALALAERGRGWTAPNPMVGAVIVKDGAVIGQGWHERYGEPHAERNALASCTADPAGGTMYVTLEPCCHHGKQPPCVDAILTSGIRRVVIGSADPNPLVAGKGVAILRSHGVEVTAMSLSSQITGMILEMLGSSGTIEIQRNELAQTIGCVPSQINYVIASRFTPEQGYIVESRRGGGGYIRIRRAAMEPDQKVMHAVNAVGDKLDERTARAHLAELVSTGVIDKHAAMLMLSAVSDNALRPAAVGDRDAVRASVFKQLLLVEMGRNG